MIRVQLDFPEERIEDLNKMMKTTGLSTRKDLFNHALTLFNWAIIERQKGRLIGCVDEDEQRFKQIMMPAIEACKPKD